MSFISFLNDKLGFHETVHGSDGRFNVSARTDERIYYVSRDKSQAYTMVFDDASATAGDFVAYLKNTDTTGKQLVIHSIGINSEAATSIFELIVVTGTQSGGATVTPTCLNRAAPKSAAASAAAPVNSNSTPMTGFTEVADLDHAGIGVSFGHEEFRIQDSIRLGQDVAVVIKLDAAAAVDKRAWGVIFFYFE